MRPLLQQEQAKTIMDTTLLTLHNLKKTYGNKTAVNIDSLAIQSHSFTCIVGKSGCGKTTLLRLLAGLEVPDTVTNVKDKTAASYSITGQNINVTSCITGLPAKTAPVFQEPRLMPWLTVKENIMFSLKGQAGKTHNSDQNQRALSNLSPDSEIKNEKTHKQNTTSINSDISLSSPEERCRQLLQELELTEASALYPSQLSGGMAQRLSARWITLPAVTYRTWCCDSFITRKKRSCSSPTMWRKPCCWATASWSWKTAISKLICP